MHTLFKRLSFWLLIAAIVFHSLTATIFTGFGFLFWILGIGAMISLRWMAYWEGVDHEKSRDYDHSGV